ncbi:MAG TPA: dihydrofolate reductase family protein [Methanomassiliicoccales archaeon]|jgi:dihydrofolate reductase
MMRGKARKVVLFIACSLDGYIAGTDDDISWLFSDDDYGYSKFLSSIDTVLMGRRTYDQVLRMGPFPYADKDCYVFSRSLMGGDDNVEFVNQPVSEFVQVLRERDGADIWLVGGSELIEAFMKERLIDEFIISIHPVVLGEGIPMLRTGLPRQDLDLKGNLTFSSGLIQVHYAKRTV